VQQASIALPSSDLSSASRWPNGPAPFLSQPRAFSALRHELDALAVAVAPTLERRRADAPERTFELHVLPHRLIARLEDVAISFSWVAGRSPTVSEGRLLVIAWRGVVTETRGIAALRSATPVVERTYRPEGGAPDLWRWRIDAGTEEAVTSAGLVDEWLARAAALSGF
jgi:hypothetical protein